MNEIYSLFNLKLSVGYAFEPIKWLEFNNYCYCLDYTIESGPDPLLLKHVRWKFIYE